MGGCPSYLDGTTNDNDNYCASSLNEQTDTEIQTFSLLGLMLEPKGAMPINNLVW